VTGVQTCALPISWRDISCPAARSGRSLLRGGLLLRAAVPRAQQLRLRPERELFPGRGEPIEHLVVSADLAGGDVGGDAPPHHGAVPDRDAVINPRPLPDHHIIASLHACTDPGAVDDAAAVADTAALTHCRVPADRRALADGRAAAYGPEELDDTAIPDPRPGADDGPGGQARPVADSGVHRHQGVPTDASVAANPCAAFDERARLDPRPGAGLGTA